MEQPSLFDDSQPTPPKEQNVADTASHIAANAPRVEHPDRTSEAAQDQGWGPVTLPEATADEPVATTPHKRLELPGKDGRRNPGSQALTPTEAQKGLSTEQIENQKQINKVGAAAARAALNGLNNQ
jgi:hypothetical protein